MNIGLTRVRKVRTALGVTRDKLAVLLGVAVVTLGRWEADANQRPHGLPLLVLEHLERAIEAGELPACVAVVAHAEQDLGAALFELLLLSRRRGAA